MLMLTLVLMLMLMLMLIVDVDGVDDKIISGHLLHTLVKLSLNLRRQHVSLVSLQEVRKAALIG